MSYGPVGFGIGIGFNIGGLVTHLVTITYEDGREYQFKATGIRDDDSDDDEPLTIYKVENGEKDYDTYVEWTDDESLTICIDGNYTFADLIDSNFDEDSKDFEFECEDDGERIYIKAEYILGQDDKDIEDIYHTSMFDLDGNIIEDDIDDGNDGESFEDLYHVEIERIDDADTTLLTEPEPLIQNAFSYLEDNEIELTDDAYAIYWDGKHKRCVCIQKIFMEDDIIYCSAIDELTQIIYTDEFSKFEMPSYYLNNLIRDVVSEVVINS